MEAQVRETWRINSRIKAEAGQLGGGEERTKLVGAQEYTRAGWLCTARMSRNNLAASGEKTRVFVLMMR